MLHLAMHIYNVIRSIFCPTREHATIRSKFVILCIPTEHAAIVESVLKVECHEGIYRIYSIVGQSIGKPR